MYFFYYMFLSSGTEFYFIIVLLLIVAIVGVWYRIFERAGVPGKYAFIPFYGRYKYYEIVWGDGKLFLLEFIPFLGAGVAGCSTVELLKRFGADKDMIRRSWFSPAVWLNIASSGVYTPQPDKNAWKDMFHFENSDWSAFVHEQFPFLCWLFKI